MKCKIKMDEKIFYFALHWCIVFLVRPCAKCLRYAGEMLNEWRRAAFVRCCSFGKAVSCLFWHNERQAGGLSYNLISVGCWEQPCFWMKIMFAEIIQRNVCKRKCRCYRPLHFHTALVCNYYVCFRGGKPLFWMAKYTFPGFLYCAADLFPCFSASWKAVFCRPKGGLLYNQMCCFVMSGVCGCVLENLVWRFSRTFFKWHFDKQSSIRRVVLTL